MFFNEWVVLLVDDEPDVLKMSKVIMRKFEVYGLPLRIFTAGSKAEAVALLKDDLEVAGSLAVAFIDVVMETDSAGLELCEYIREGMGNRHSQLFIRTGQPGIATERDVIDRYDINGYFTKAEATQNKLYSLVKSSVRQYLSFGMSLTTISVLSDLIAAAKSRERVLEAIHHLVGFSMDLEDTPRWLVVDGKVLFEEEVDAEKAIELCEKLLSHEGTPLNPAGDRHVRGDDGYQLIHVSGKPDQTVTTYLFQTRFSPPEHIIDLMHSVVVGVATAWQQSH